MLIRDAAIYVAVLFLPLVFAGLVWPAAAPWSKRLVETIVAIILSKFVIVAVLSLAASALAFQVLKWVGLQHRMNAFPEELSGGEQQRIAIARALVNDPQLVLADEPTGNLDPDLSLDIMNLFREINARGTTVVVATHDRELIQRVGRRAVSLEHGVIVEVE